VVTDFLPVPEEELTAYNAMVTELRAQSAILLRVPVGEVSAPDLHAESVKRKRKQKELERSKRKSEKASAESSEEEDVLSESSEDDDFSLSSDQSGSGSDFEDQPRRRVNRGR
jgi:hypothetical protein